MTQTFPVLHPVPEGESRWNYDHLPPLYRTVDTYTENVTGTGSVEAGLVRLVAGYDRNRRTWDRPPDSWISLDTYSIGIAHWWAETAPDLLARIANEQPQIAAYAWGDVPAEMMRDPDWLVSITGTRRGKAPHDPRLNWLLAGWYEIARHPVILRIQFDHWLQRYARRPLEYMAAHNWRKASTLAALVRHNNSGGMSRSFDEAIRRLGSDRDETAVAELAMSDPDLYDKPERWATILSMPEFRGNAPTSVSAARFDYTRPVSRVDGTLPGWATGQSPRGGGSAIVLALVAGAVAWWVVRGGT